MTKLPVARLVSRLVVRLVLILAGSSAIAGAQPYAPPQVGGGVEDINDTGSRWSMPITGLVGWRF